MFKIITPQWLKPQGVKQGEEHVPDRGTPSKEFRGLGSVEGTPSLERSGSDAIVPNAHTQLQIRYQALRSDLGWNEDTNARYMLPSYLRELIDRMEATLSYQQSDHNQKSAQERYHQYGHLLHMKREERSVISNDPQIDLAIDLGALPQDPEVVTTVERWKEAISKKQSLLTEINTCLDGLVGYLNAENYGSVVRFSDLEIDDSAAFLEAQRYSQLDHEPLGKTRLTALLAEFNKVSEEIRSLQLVLNKHPSLEDPKYGSGGSANIVRQGENLLPYPVQIIAKYDNNSAYSTQPDLKSFVDNLPRFGGVVSPVFTYKVISTEGDSNQLVLEVDFPWQILTLARRLYEQLVNCFTRYDFFPVVQETLKLLKTELGEPEMSDDEALEILHKGYYALVSGLQAGVGRLKLAIGSDLGVTYNTEQMSPLMELLDSRSLPNTHLHWHKSPGRWDIMSQFMITKKGGGEMRLVDHSAFTCQYILGGTHRTHPETNMGSYQTIIENLLDNNPRYRETICSKWGLDQKTLTHQSTTLGGLIEAINSGANIQLLSEEWGANLIYTAGLYNLQTGKSPFNLAWGYENTSFLVLTDGSGKKVVTTFFQHPPAVSGNDMSNFPELAEVESTKYSSLLQAVTDPALHIYATYGRLVNDKAGPTTAWFMKYLDSLEGSNSRMVASNFFSGKEEVRVASDNRIPAPGVGGYVEWQAKYFDTNNAEHNRNEGINIGNSYLYYGLPPSIVGRILAYCPFVLTARSEALGIGPIEAYLSWKKAVEEGWENVPEIFPVPLITEDSGMGVAMKQWALSGKGSPCVFIQGARRFKDVNSAQEYLSNPLRGVRDGEVLDNQDIQIINTITREVYDEKQYFAVDEDTQITELANWVSTFVHLIVAHKKYQMVMKDTNEYKAMSDSFVAAVEATQGSQPLLNNFQKNLN